MEHKVVVAMSGGVDSSVAAVMLKEAGYEVIGVSMQVWDYRQNGGCRSRATCCAPDDFCDARRVAHSAGIPYYVFDFEETFREKVIDKFVSMYEQGETPNPCIDCNSKVKFKELRKRAEALGFPCVATGHYARIEKHVDGFHLLRGSDSAKDQSYFLYNLSQRELAETLFPVGHLSKPEVRELARKAGLVTAEKKESQDICFVSGKIQDFLVQLGSRPKPGPIVDRQGQKIGEHQGIETVTVGQRKGLNLGGSKDPLYVLEIDPQANRVIVGEKHELERETFQVSELSLVAPQLIQQMAANYSAFEFECIAQLRYRHKGVKVRVSVRDSTKAIVQFMDNWATVSPGQAAVFYDLESGMEVLGGGRINANRNTEYSF